MKRLRFLLVLPLIWGTASCSSKDETVVKVTEITLNTYAVTITVGGNEQLSVVKVLPEEATDKGVTWSSDVPHRATVDETGLITVPESATPGTVKITATAKDNSGVKATCVVTVEPAFVAVSGITGVPEATYATMPLLLTGTVAPATATHRTIAWSVQSAGTTGATITGSTLNTTAAGTAMVRATITNGATATTDYTQDFSIVVSLFVIVEDITGVPATAIAGTLLTLTGTVLPTAATNSAITWSVQDAGTTGATISNGNQLNTTATGTVKVRAIITNGAAPTTNYIKDFTITVSFSFVAVTDITDVPTTATESIPLTLTGSVVPTTATNKAIMWSIQDAGTTGATISNGNQLNTTTTGTAKVRATIANGTAEGTPYTKDFDIIVAQLVPVYTISASPNPSFGSLPEGYTQPAAQTVTIQNTGNSPVTLNPPTSTHYDIGALSTPSLAAGATATFTVRPKTGLIVGTYDEKIDITGSNSTSTSVTATFAVTELGQAPPHKGDNFEDGGPF